MKPTVYVETSIISYLTARQSNDLRSMANKSATIEWWETQKPKYEVVVSEFVIAEAGLGHPEAAERRLAAIEGIMELQATEAVRVLGRELISRSALPAKAEIDAYHVAIAAVNADRVFADMELHPHCKCNHTAKNRSNMQGTWLRTAYYLHTRRTNGDLVHVERPYRYRDAPFARAIRKPVRAQR